MSEILLAMDTATEACAIALGEQDSHGVSPIGSVDIEAPRAALTRLLPQVTALLSRHGLASSDIARVVVGLGPGSFTGVRIGVATAKGVAQGLAVPLFGVGTLDAVAYDFVQAEGMLGVVGDAMRGEVYPALFALAEGKARRVEADRVCSPETAAREWASRVEGELMLAGNGLGKYEEVFVEALGERARVMPRERWLPKGEGLLRVYAAKLAESDLGDGNPATVLPIYTRLSDAEEAEKARRGAVEGAAGGRVTPSAGVQDPGPKESM